MYEYSFTCAHTLARSYSNIYKVSDTKKTCNEKPELQTTTPATTSNDDKAINIQPRKTYKKAQKFHFTIEL